MREERIQKDTKEDYHGPASEVPLNSASLADNGPTLNAGFVAF